MSTVPVTLASGLPAELGFALTSLLDPLGVPVGLGFNATVGLSGVLASSGGDGLISSSPAGRSVTPASFWTGILVGLGLLSSSALSDDSPDVPGLASTSASTGPFPAAGLPSGLKFLSAFSSSGFPAPSDKVGTPSPVSPSVPGSGKSSGLISPPVWGRSGLSGDTGRCFSEAGSTFPGLSGNRGRSFRSSADSVVGLEMTSKMPLSVVDGCVDGAPGSISDSSFESASSFSLALDGLSG